MPGPAPNPNARRRNTGTGFTTLPAAGRNGPPPAWPFRTDHAPFRGRRKTLWDQLWATPMALLWDRHKWAVPVARYVEMVLEYEAEPRKASAALLSEMRQAEQLLAMTATGLLKARAAIDLTAAPDPGAPSAQVLLLPTRGDG